jgi:serralysin
MANPQPVYWGYSGDPVIDAMTNGFVWILGPDKTIDWSVSGGFAGEYWRNADAIAYGVGQILSTFSYYADVKFNYLGSFTNPLVAKAAGSEIDITLSASTSFFPSSNTWARGFFPEPDSYATYYVGEAGDVYLNINSQANYLSTYAPGSAGWFVFLHELGHTLGLKHPHDDGGFGRPTLAQIGLASLDDDWATVMSYNDDYSWNLAQWDPATPMVLDVLALQYLYGPNMATNAGDTVFQLTRTNLYVTAWDASGNDTVDASGSSEGWMIVLPSVEPSKVVPTKVGLATPIADLSLVAPKTLEWLMGDIENATGSSSADVIFGTDAPNILKGAGGDDYLFGGGGNDFIDGGSGSDSAHYAGSILNFSVSHSATSWTVADHTLIEGTDTLTNVETLVFSDKTIDLSVTAAAADVSAASLQSVVELYIAFFNRVPDSEGMTYWLQQVAGNTSITQIANSFYTAALQYPTLTGYSSTMSNADFVTMVYKNVLGRTTVDSSGMQYWTTALANGTETHGTLVESILTSAHTFKGDATYGWVADLLDNKYAVGKLFAIDEGLSFNTPADSIQQGMAIAAAVTPTDTHAAISLIGVSASAIHLT